MRITAALLAVGIAMTVQAQNTVESIRKEYGEMQELIRHMMQEGACPPEYYNVHVVQNLPATGPHDENIYMYYGELESEEEGDPYPPHYLRFATAKYNFAVRQFYEEFMYNDKGQVTFIYARLAKYHWPLITELRMWYDGKRLLQLMVKDSGEQPDDGKAVLKEVYKGKNIPEEYSDTYNVLVNRAERYKVMFKGIDDNTHL